jgi:hypothetical protein
MVIAESLYDKLVMKWVAAATCSRWFLARGFFYPEDGGDTFLRNVGSHKIYTTPHPRRRHSSGDKVFEGVFLVSPQLINLMILA